jgi:hypothetical protein
LIRLDCFSFLLFFIQFTAKSFAANNGACTRGETGTCGFARSGIKRQFASLMCIAFLVGTRDFIRAKETPHGNGFQDLNLVITRAKHGRACWLTIVEDCTELILRDLAQCWNNEAQAKEQQREYR